MLILLGVIHSKIARDMLSELNDSYHLSIAALGFAEQVNKLLRLRRTVLFLQHNA